MDFEEFRCNCFWMVNDGEGRENAWQWDSLFQYITYQKTVKKGRAVPNGYGGFIDPIYPLVYRFDVLHNDDFDDPDLLFNIYDRENVRLKPNFARGVLGFKNFPTSLDVQPHPLLITKFYSLSFEMLNNPVGEWAFVKNPILKFLLKYGPHVALQFPDSALHHSVQIVRELQEWPGSFGLALFVLGDTSYGSCCVDEIAAAHANADGIVHFGHACLSKVARIPVLYVFLQLTFNTEHLLACLFSELTECTIPLVCFYEIAYANAVNKAKNVLVERFPNATIATVAEPDQQADLLCWKLDAAHDKQSDERIVLYVGRDNLSFFNTAVAFAVSHCLLYDPSRADPRLERTDALGAKWLRRRYYAIERCMDARAIGIVVATLSTKGYLEIVSRVQRLAKARGVRTYLISIGKVNPEKLANFVDIDCFVLVGCPENDVFTSREFFRPLLSVFEAEMGLNVAWREKLLASYTTNFADLLPNGRLYSDVDEVAALAKEVNETADVSLITGRARHATAREEVNGLQTNDTCTEVAAKGRNEIAQITSADQFGSRSWQGLEQKLGQDAPALVQEGRSGIPIRYKSDPNSSD
uniref:2-(3-amino-3-carboxypropyl)histidine synthase subunit 2 n=1 Tax=Anopheles epiroticus TaxID=199890 RepID=A0A182PL49_9DIPT